MYHISFKIVINYKWNKVVWVYFFYKTVLHKNYKTLCC